MADLIPASSPGADLQQLDLEAAPLGPAHLHPQDHLRPILGVGAAGAGVDRDERVAGVVAPREQALLLERGETRSTPASCSLSSPASDSSSAGELGQLRELGDVGLERGERLELARRAGVLGADLRRALGVVPEAGLAHLRLERAAWLRSAAGSR